MTGPRRLAAAVAVFACLASAAQDVHAAKPQKVVLARPAGVTLNPNGGVATASVNIHPALLTNPRAVRITIRLTERYGDGTTKTLGTRRFYLNEASVIAGPFPDGSFLVRFPFPTRALLEGSTVQECVRTWVRGVSIRHYERKYICN